jgi:hypothetical protein
MSERAIVDRQLVEIWTFGQVPSLGGIDLTGFTVEATDGEIGTVDEATYEVGESYLIVDIGPWIFGKKLLLPAGVVARIDADKKRIFLDCKKDSIKNAPQAPEYDPNFGWVDRSFRDRLGRHYCGR